MSPKPFLVCIHDAAPVFHRETEQMLADLEPLVGDRLGFAVVPDWWGQWSLAEHPEYCALLRDSGAELLLHGYRHQRTRGWDPGTFFAEGHDELPGVPRAEARAFLEEAQRHFAAAFGAPARGFLPPTWQMGPLRLGGPVDPPVEWVMGFFSVDSREGAHLPLATWTWDCGRWAWLGHLGDALGEFMGLFPGRIPTLAIHPRDLPRGFWPRILELTRRLLDAGYQPARVEELLPCTSS